MSQCTFVARSKPSQNGFEYSVHTCPPSFERELKHVFPDLECCGMVAIPTMQHAHCDLVEIGELVELEKDRLLNEVLFLVIMFQCSYE